MLQDNRPALTGDAQANSLLRREAAGRAFASDFGTSPPALEATLVSISSGVMAEAVERLRLRAKPEQLAG